MKINTCLALVGLIVLSAPAAANSTATCKAIDAAISANEEYVEAILEASPDARVKARRDMTALNRELGTALTTANAKSSATAIAAVDSATVAGKDRDAMLAAMQNYAVLVENFKTRLPTTQNVAMLDHAGFSLQALTANGSPVWAMVKTVQTALAADVKAIDGQLEKGPLADLLRDTVASIDAAIAQSDVKWLSASALILLDSVDLVEAVVKNKTSKACP